MWCIPFQRGLLPQLLSTCHHKRLKVYGNSSLTWNWEALMQPMVEISIIRQYVLVVEENFVTRGNEYRRDEIANQNPHLVPKQIMVFAASISALYTQITLCVHISSTKPLLLSKSTNNLIGKLTFLWNYPKESNQLIQNSSSSSKLFPGKPQLRPDSSTRVINGSNSHQYMLHYLVPLWIHQHRDQVMASNHPKLTWEENPAAPRQQYACYQWIE
jgi:hypothetical protein